MDQTTTDSRPFANAARIFAFVPVLAIVLAFAGLAGDPTLNTFLAGVFAAPISAAIGLLLGVASAVRKEPGSAKWVILANAAWLVAMAVVVYLVSTNPIDFR